MSRSTPPRYSRDERFKGQRIREARKAREAARDHAAAMARVPLMDRLSDAGIPTTHAFQQEQTSLR